MKRNGYVVEVVEVGKVNITNRQIACEVTGEMEDGTKVWTNIENENEQFYARRIGGQYFFLYL